MQEKQVLFLDWEDPLERGMATTPVFLPEESHGQRSLDGYSPEGCKELDTTEQLHTHNTNKQAGLPFLILWLGLPRWLRGKESACNAEDSEDVGSIPGLERSPREGNGYPLQYSCLENSLDRGVLQAGYSPWSCKESDKTSQLTTTTTTTILCLAILFNHFFCVFVFIF